MTTRQRNRPQASLRRRQRATMTLAARGRGGDGANDWRRLIDSVVCEDAARLLEHLPQESVDLVASDPPYGSGTQVSAWRSPAFRFAEIEGVDAINNTWLKPAYRACKVGGAAYIFAKWVNVGDWIHEIESVGFNVQNCIIWDKLQHGTGDLTGAYAPQYEMILFATKGRHILRGKRPIDVIRYPKVQPTALVHPYEKPIGLLEQLILNSTDRGALVVDCFSGSGATLLAAQKLGRRYIGCDISPDYVALANKRLALPYDVPLFAADTDAA